MRLLHYFKRGEAIQCFRRLDGFAMLAILFALLLICITLMRSYQVANGDHDVPEVQSALPDQTEAVIQYAALFGEYQGAKPLQESGLNLQLTAVFAMDDPKSGSAVISASGRKALLQVVGDVMPGGVKLKEVHSDYVVLEQGGEQSILRLPKKSL